MKRNIYLTWSGIETLVVGLFLSLQRHIMQDDPNDKVVHFTQHLGDVDWAFVMISLGLIATIVGLVRFNRWHFQSLIIILLGAIWCAYFVVFFIQDIHFGGNIQLSTVVTGLIFVSIVIEARFGGGGK